MYYGLTGQFEASKICSRVCVVLGNGYNETAVQLLLETAMQETHLGKYRDPTPGGAGMGLCQFDEIAFLDVKQRTRHPDIAKIKRNFDVDLMDIEHRELRFSPVLSFLFCRLFYRLIPEQIPKTVSERAAYWKKYYNTAKGKGTAEEYIHNANRIEVQYR